MPLSRAECRLAVRVSECRVWRCSLPAQGDLGFCAQCEAVHHAARSLRTSLVERRGARVAAAHPDIFNNLSSGVRRRLLLHLAAQPACIDRNATDMAALEDFFGELYELGLAGREGGKR